MKETFEQNKKVILGVVGVLIVGFIIFFAMNRSTPAPEVETAVAEDEEAPIPTVDSSVVVDLVQVKTGEVEISISNAPAGTETVDVELSYETEGKGLQGQIALIQIEDGAGTKDVTLGTCSSGTCIYHEPTSGIKLFLKFNGTYGEQIFEQNFTI